MTTKIKEKLISEMIKKEEFLAQRDELRKVLQSIEMETHRGGQWTIEEINEAARAALEKCK
jgi:hypothetical protein